MLQYAALLYEYAHTMLSTPLTAYKRHIPLAEALPITEMAQRAIIRDLDEIGFSSQMVWWIWIARCIRLIYSEQCLAARHP